MKYKAALVVVKNISETRKLYEDVLGCKVTADYGQNVMFENGFLFMRRSTLECLLTADR